MIYLFGASGHGLVILDILHRLQQPVQAFIDDADKPPVFGGIPVMKSSAFQPGPEDQVIVSIGSNEARRTVAGKLAGMHFGTAVHPQAIVSTSETSIGEGSVVMAGAVLNPYVRVGRHCIINTCASIDHECQLGDFVHVSPNATLCGNVQVGHGAWIAAGSTIVPGVRIGAGAVIGAGTVVRKDVPPGGLVVGNPGKLMKVKETNWL
ncbi:MAG: acetyltransferase [Chitinophagaceae bacterium]|jgi:sugar O-acyltransferase (sialic acid O-acetyltransferase NeuD family)|nr:acetyltransferase [Chitinophagaceae bacterium]